MMHFLLPVAFWLLIPFATADEVENSLVGTLATAAADVLADRLFGRVWRPKIGQEFQIVLSATVDANKKNGPLVPEHVPIWDIDVFDNSRETITQLRRSGKKVICYFSAGTSEDWRDDFKVIKPKDMGAALPMWPGERWLDLRSREVLSLMKKRIRYAARQGCDAVDPDNMDGYENEGGGGFDPPLTKKDTIKFMRQLSRYAHSYGMSIGLKNALDVLPQLSSYVEFAVNEECASEPEACEEYRPFLHPTGLLGRGKPVFHIEYVERIPVFPNGGFTAQAGEKPIGWKIENRLEALNLTRELTQEELRKRLCALQNPNIGSYMSNVIKIMNLDGWVMSCGGQVWETRGVPISKEPKDQAAKGSSGKDSKANESKGKEAKGKDAKGKEAKGRESKGKESKGKEAKGRESKGQEAKGKGAKGKDSKSNDAKGKDSKSNDAKGKDSKSNEAKVTDSKSNESKSNEAKSMEAKSNEAKSNEAKSMEAKSNEAKSNEAKSIEAKSNEAKSNEAQNNEAKSTETKSNEAKSTEAKSTEAKSTEAKSMDASSRDSEAREAQSEEVQSSRLILPDDPSGYQAILNMPNDPFDAAFDALLEKELAGFNNTSKRRGAAKDRRGARLPRRRVGS